eukprot:jgi/Mesvir1/18631/Mv17140-RA.1
MDANAGKSRRMRGGEDAWTDLLEGEGVMKRILDGLSEEDVVNVGKAAGEGTRTKRMANERVAKESDKRYRATKKKLFNAPTRSRLQDNVVARGEEFTNARNAYRATKALHDLQRERHEQEIRRLAEVPLLPGMPPLPYAPFDEESRRLERLQRARDLMRAGIRQRGAWGRVMPRGREEPDDVRKRLKKQLDVESRDLGEANRAAGREKEGVWTPSSRRIPVWDDVAAHPRVLNKVMMLLGTKDRASLGAVNKKANLAARTADVRSARSTYKDLTEAKRTERLGEIEEELEGMDELIRDLYEREDAIMEGEPLPRRPPFYTSLGQVSRAISAADERKVRLTRDKRLYDKKSPTQRAQVMKRLRENVKKARERVKRKG